MDLDSKALITLVFDRPALWDKKHKYYSKRVVTNKCWKDISREMKHDEFTLRKRWRYLRDQFAVECGKIPSACSEDEAASYNPKWPYFKQLLFLKSVVTPRDNSVKRGRHERTSSVDTDQDNILEITHDFDQDAQTNEEDQPESDHFTGSSWSSRNASNTRLRRTYSYNDEMLYNIEQQNLRNMEPEDESLLFFKSLLPHVHKIPEHLMLPFRNRIQDIVSEFAYHTHILRFNNRPMSEFNLSDDSRLDNSEIDVKTPALFALQRHVRNVINDHPEYAASSNIPQTRRD